MWTYNWLHIRNSLFSDKTVLASQHIWQKRAGAVSLKTALQQCGSWRVTGVPEWASRGGGRGARVACVCVPAHTWVWLLAELWVTSLWTAGPWSASELLVRAVSLLETPQQGSVAFHSRGKGVGGDCGRGKRHRFPRRNFFRQNSGRTDSYNEVSINNVSSLLV